MRDKCRDPVGRLLLLLVHIIMGCGVSLPSSCVCASEYVCCVYVTVCLAECICGSSWLCLSVCLSLCLYLYLGLYGCLYVYVSPRVTLSVCLCFSMTVYVSVWCLRISLSVCVSSSSMGEDIYVCLDTFLSVLFTCMCVFLVWVSLSECISKYGCYSFCTCKCFKRVYLWVSQCA